VTTTPSGGVDGQLHVRILAAGAAGDHLGGVGGFAQDLADSVERDREHVVQNERQALARG
jgi:hypothetical protein